LHSLISVCPAITLYRQHRSRIDQDHIRSCGGKARARPVLQRRPEHNEIHAVATHQSGTNRKPPAFRDSGGILHRVMTGCSPGEMNHDINSGLRRPL
jgi:hypothetical protein